MTKAERAALLSLDFHELPRPLTLDTLDALPRRRLRRLMQGLHITEPHQSRKADLVHILLDHEAAMPPVAPPTKPYHRCTRGCGLEVFNEADFTRLFGWRNDNGTVRGQPQCRKCRSVASRLSKQKRRAM